MVLVVNLENRIAIAIDSYTGNPHVSQTFRPLIEQMKEHLDYTPSEIVYDRGGRGQKIILGVPITTPSKKSKNQTPYHTQKIRNKFKRRAAIKPIISHLKQHFRMWGQNYHYSTNSSKINALLAVTRWNLKKKMEALKNWLENLMAYFFKLS